MLIRILGNPRNFAELLCKFGLTFHRCRPDDLHHQAFQMVPFCLFQHFGPSLKALQYIVEVSQAFLW